MGRQSADLGGVVHKVLTGTPQGLVEIKKRTLTT